MGTAEHYRDLVADVLGFGPDEVPDDSTSLRDLEGWDSLKHVRLVVGLEERLGAQLEADEIEGLATLGDVRRVLDRLGP